MEKTATTTRRAFLGTSAGAVAATALSQMAISPAVRAAGSDTVTIALIGCGGRGSGAAYNALRTSGGPVQLIAMADAFRDRLDHSYQVLTQNFPDKVNVPEERKFVGFDAYKHAIDLGPDMVILATPPGFRPIHFEYAIKQGRHVFMEKPVAVDAPGVRQVLAAAEEAKKKGLKVGVGLQRHHDPAYIETINRIRDGAIGEVNFMRAYWNGTTPWVRTRAELLKQKPDLTEMEYQMRNWYFFNWLCGDHINEQHIHNIDVCCWLKNDYPIYAQGQGGRQVRTGKDYGEIYDHHFVEYTFRDGSVMLSQCRQMDNTLQHVAEYAHGSKGTSQLSGTINVKGERPWRYRGERVDPYQAEHEALFRAIRNNEEFNEAFNGALSTMTSIMGRMATYSGARIEWDKALASELSLMPEKFDFNANPPVMPNEDGYYPIPTPGVTRVL